MWTYGPKGSAHPVRPGQVWRAGRHVFICGSIFDVDLLGEAVTLVYADPPWNQGNLKAFHTKAGLGPPAYGYLDLYHRIFELAAGLPCFVEGGEREADSVMELAEGEVYARWSVTYYRTRPSVLHYTGPPGLPPGLHPCGLDDSKLPEYVLSQYPVGCVLDPCAGRGLTARSAEKLGWSSVNVELHPNRVSAALEEVGAGHGRLGHDLPLCEG